MTIIVNPLHPAYPQYALIVGIKAQIAALPAGSPFKPALQVQLVEWQRQLVDALMAHGLVPASAILSSLTLPVADSNAL